MGVDTPRRSLATPLRRVSSSSSYLPSTLLNFDRSFAFALARASPVVPSFAFPASAVLPSFDAPPPPVSPFLGPAPPPRIPNHCTVPPPRPTPDAPQPPTPSAPRNLTPIVSRAAMGRPPRRHAGPPGLATAQDLMCRARERNTNSAPREGTHAIRG